MYYKTRIFNMVWYSSEVTYIERKVEIYYRINCVGKQRGKSRLLNSISIYNMYKYEVIQVIECKIGYFKGKNKRYPA